MPVYLLLVLLRGFAGWSTPSLFAYNKAMFSRHRAPISTHVVLLGFVSSVATCTRGIWKVRNIFFFFFFFFFYISNRLINPLMFGIFYTFHARIQTGVGGGGAPPENHKNIGFLSNIDPDPLKITKVPSQHCDMYLYTDWQFGCLKDKKQMDMILV